MTDIQFIALVAIISLWGGLTQKLISRRADELKKQIEELRNR